MDNFGHLAASGKITPQTRHESFEDENKYIFKNISVADNTDGSTFHNGKNSMILYKMYLVVCFFRFQCFPSLAKKWLVIMQLLHMQVSIALCQNLEFLLAKKCLVKKGIQFFLVKETYKLSFIKNCSYCIFVYLYLSIYLYLCFVPH